MIIYERYDPRQEVYAALFFGVFSFVFAAILLFSYFAAGPIVLGTEMNTNGLVEYLCLGQGCDALYDMDW